VEEAIHRFVRLLRRQGVRIGVSEALDAMTASAQTGVLSDREITRAALRVCLVKDRRDEHTFDRVFDLFFGLRAVNPPDDAGHGHAHDDLEDTGTLQQFTLSEDPSDIPEQGHFHGKPDDIREFFNPEDLSQQYNLHQEANKLDLASLTDEIVLSADNQSLQDQAARVQLTTQRLANPGRPGELVTASGLELDVELSVAQEGALLDWLNEQLDTDDGRGLDPEELAALRARLAGLLEGLPQKLRSHLESLMAAEAELETREVKARGAERVGEHQRAELEESVRRLIRSLRGAPRSRRTVAARGTVDGRRTMRTNMRYDGIPFRPVTVSKVSDRPRLVILTDVSLSVRATARFTLHLVHGLQSLASSVRSFAFVSDLVEITDLFAEHPLDEALGLVVAGLPAGGVLDVDADSDHGAAFGTFLEQYGSAVNRRTTVIILGDGRNNGRDPNLAALEEISRRARETVWLTPEPRYSWGLGSCDLPAYAAYCDRVQVVRDLAGLERANDARTEVAQ
jgi:uncharacterized protein with von Willebrand factor type A (vWA) domain